MAHALPSGVRPEFAHLELDEMLLGITVPEETKVGDIINVAGLDGRVFSIQVPVGCKPGSQLNVVVKKPESTEGGVGGPPLDDVGPPTVELEALGVAPVDSPLSSEVVEEPKDRSPTDSRSVAAAAGAGAAGAVVGAVVLGAVTGPAVAAVVVGGAAVYGTTRDDNIGETIRNVGAKTADAAGYVKDKADEYHVVEKAKAGASAAVAKAKEVNEKYDVTGKTKAAASATYAKGKEINEEYDLTGKAARGASAVASKAKQVNEEYDLTGKAARAGSAALGKVSEINSEYDISGKAAAAGSSALMAGLSVFQKAKAAARGSESERSGDA